jgi:hypothetical protein
MLTNGLYKASFRTPNDFGDGVIYLQDGHAYGGDSNFYYTAQYSAQNSKIIANFVFKQHTSGNESVFGVESGTLEVTGTYTANSVTLAAGDRFQVKLTLLEPVKTLTPAR